LPLSLELVLVALDDGTGDEADLVHLGDVGGFGGVFAVFVEPALETKKERLVSPLYQKFDG